MSNFILCKGDYQKMSLGDIKIIDYPFKNKYLQQASHYLWNDEIRHKLWIVINSKTSDIDSFFTDAQEKLNHDILFSQTRLFYLLCSLLECASEIVIWYSDYTEEIPIVNDKEEFLRKIEEQVKDPTCEIYIRYQAHSVCQQNHKQRANQ